MSDSDTRTAEHDTQAAAEKKSMKVTDRRMFTAAGELREEYRHLESVEAREPEPAKPEPEPPPEPEPEPPEPDPDQPSFVDLVRLLADNAAVYLQQAGIPDGHQQEHLEVARLHIDLLGVLKDKTKGNLSRQEREMLDDVLYQLRMAVSGRRGF